MERLNEPKTRIIGGKLWQWNEATKSYYRAILAPSLQMPKLERSLGNAAFRQNKRKKKGTKRFRVRVVGHSRHPIDPCNFCTKYIVDALRFAGIIEDDSWAHIELEAKQKKVERDCDVGTQIEIEEIL